MSEILPGASTRRVTAPRGPRAGTPVTLAALAVTVAVQVAVELAYVVGRDGLTVVARVCLLALVAAQLLLVWRTVRLSPGAALCVFVTELATVLAVAANSEMGWPVRLVLATGAVVATVSLAVSLRAFPTPVLPGGQP